MSRQAYENMRSLANDIRAQYGMSGARVIKSQIRRIYRDQGIHVDYWPNKLKHLRGAYFPNEGSPSVLVAKHLPVEQQIFTLAHELKHHLADREAAFSYCDPTNRDTVVEVSAEVFAAELIFPQALFAELLESAGVARGACSADDIVRLKVNSATTLSYQGLVKMAEFLRFAERGSFTKFQFRKRQEQMYGEPIYKQIQRRRKQLPRL